MSRGKTPRWAVLALIRVAVVATTVAPFGRARADECEAPTALSLTRVVDSARDDDRAAAALDAVAQQCFDPTGKWDGGASRRVVAKGASGDPCGGAVKACQAAGRDFQAQRATRAEVTQIWTALRTAFRDHRYRIHTEPRDVPDAPFDCAGHERDALTRAAAARKDSAASLRATVREHQSFRTWLFFQALDCRNPAQELARLQTLRAQAVTAIHAVAAPPPAETFLRLRAEAATRWTEKAQARVETIRAALERVEHLRGGELQRRLEAAAITALQEGERRLSTQMRLAAGYVQRAGALAKYADSAALAAALSGRLDSLKTLAASIDKPKLAGAVARTIAREFHAPRAVQKVADRVAQSLVAQFERSEAAREAKVELESQWTEMRAADVEAHQAFEAQVQAQREAGLEQRRAHDASVQSIPPTVGVPPVLDARGATPAPHAEASARVLQALTGTMDASFLPMEDMVDCADAACLAARAEALQVEALGTWRLEREGAGCAVRVALLDAVSGTVSFACTETAQCDDPGLFDAATRCAEHMKGALHAAR